MVYLVYLDYNGLSSTSKTFRLTDPYAHLHHVFQCFLGCHDQLCTVTCPGDMSSIPQVLHRTAKPVTVAEFVDAVQAICLPRFPGSRGRQARPVGML